MPITYSQTMEPGHTTRPNYNHTEAGALEGFQRQSRGGGASRWRQGRGADYLQRVASAAELIADILNPNSGAPSWLLKEALRPTNYHTLRAINERYPGLVTPGTLNGGGIQESYSTSDFPNLMGDVLDRMLLGRFREFPQGWRQYVKVSRPLRDFRTVRRLALNGAEGQYTKQTEYDSIDYSQTLDEDNYTYAPSLYSLGVKLSFQQLMNDDLDAFDTIPDRLGRGGRRTIAKFVTDLLFDANGPDATFFSSGNGNIVSLSGTANPDLAIDALGAAIEQLLGFTDADSEPILVEGVTLIYPPALHITVQNLLNQLTVDYPGVAPGVDGDITVRVNNWIIRGINAVMDPYIPIVATTGTVGATSWILASTPTSDRPMAEVGFLAGFEEPQLFTKQSDTLRIGGGIDQMAGDFETMSTHYKGVLGFGGTLLDPKSAVASKGTNS